MPRDEKLYTERDIILAKREGYLAARAHRTPDMEPCRKMETDGECPWCEAHAAQRFPLPTVTRPRVVADKYGDCWRVVDGQFEFRNRHRTEWESVNECWRPTAGYVALWADLLANPTEEVDDAA